MTIKSLQDLGYSVNENVAEAFEIPNDSVTGGGVSDDGNTYSGDTFESESPTVLDGGFFRNLNIVFKILVIVGISVVIVVVSTCLFYMFCVPKQNSRRYIEKVVRIEQPKNEITVVL
mmetsp:Transcript_7419/g.8966  ORF Transcript_7419/g.8966 Transcript_7419/m.8966 type:complete len:117 (+) Transcript_7419:36-386(+)